MIIQRCHWHREKLACPKVCDRQDKPPAPAILVRTMHNRHAQEVVWSTVMFLHITPGPEADSWAHAPLAIRGTTPVHVHDHFVAQKVCESATMHIDIMEASYRYWSLASTIPLSCSQFSLSQPRCLDPEYAP